MGAVAAEGTVAPVPEHPPCRHGNDHGGWRGFLGPGNDREWKHGNGRRRGLSCCGGLCRGLPLAFLSCVFPFSFAFISFSLLILSFCSFLFLPFRSRHFSSLFAFVPAFVFGGFTHQHVGGDAAEWERSREAGQKGRQSTVQAQDATRAYSLLTPWYIALTARAV